MLGSAYNGEGGLNERRFNNKKKSKWFKPTHSNPLFNMPSVSTHTTRKSFLSPNSDSSTKNYIFKNMSIPHKFALFLHTVVEAIRTGRTGRVEDKGWG